MPDTSAPPLPANLKTVTNTVGITRGVPDSPAERISELACNISQGDPLDVSITAAARMSVARRSLQWIANHLFCQQSIFHLFIQVPYLIHVIQQTSS
jgi:hypothetical protein